MKIRPQRQKGYAAVFSIVLFSALALSFLAMFNSGQITSHKIKLQNAVDAASYSTAVVVSRELNFMAYTNRAMVANQVAVGQVVGMVSWLKMMKEASVNIHQVTKLVSWIPIIGQIIEAYMTYVENAVKYADIAFSDYLAKLLVAEADLVISALAQSQNVMHIAMNALIPATYHGVLQDNDPDAVLSAIGAASLLNYTSKFAGSNKNGFLKRTEEAKSGSSDLGKYDKFATVVKDSRDQFTTSRSYDWIHPPAIPFVVEMWIAKNGGNEFDKKLQNGKYVWEWSSMDTVSFWTRWYDLKKLRWKSPRETLPIGWGAAHTSDESGSYQYSNSNSLWFNSYDTSKWGGAGKNRMSASLAESEYGDNKIGGATGLDRFFFMTDTKKIPDIPSFIAVAGKDSGSVRTWKEIVEKTGGQVGTRFNIEEVGNLKSGQMFSMAKAEAYYARAYDLDEFRRDDQYMEFGNLFNPYWQARLTSLTPNEKAAVLLSLPK